MRIVRVLSPLTRIAVTAAAVVTASAGAYFTVDHFHGGAHKASAFEQLQGQVNSITSRTQFSTISVSVAPAIVPVGTPSSTWDPAKTVAQAFAPSTRRAAT